MANLITAAELQTALPEFAGVAPSVVDFWITLTDEEIDHDRWGTRGKAAEMYLAAHKMVIAGVVNPAQAAGSGGASGAIQSVKVGDVSVSYGSTASLAVQLQGLDPSLATTKYGIEYARLVRSKGFGAEVI